MSPRFIFEDAFHISGTYRARKFKFGVLVGNYRCKNLSARGRLRRSATPSFYFAPPLHISVTNGCRKLKFSTLVGRVYFRTRSTRKNENGRKFTLKKIMATGRPTRFKWQHRGSVTHSRLLHVRSKLVVLGE